MKIKTTELTGAALDWAVATIEENLWAKYNFAVYNDHPKPPRPSEYLQDNNFSPDFSPSTDWSQGGPIIDRELIQTSPCGAQPEDGWQAALTDEDGKVRFMNGPTLLVAAMRCYVASKLGDEVDVPEELQ